MANHLRAELVLDALDMALGQPRPRDVVCHSDQGSQYTSLAFGERCAEAGAVAEVVESGGGVVSGLFNEP